MCRKKRNKQVSTKLNVSHMHIDNKMIEIKHNAKTEENKKKCHQVPLYVVFFINTAQS